MPMGTFKGTHPDTWDDLLRKIVVPIGTPETILETFHDRDFYDTTPPWKNAEDKRIYAVPRAIYLPRDTPIQPKKQIIPLQDVGRLEILCRDATTRLQDLGTAELTLLLQSYANVQRRRPKTAAHPQCPQKSGSPAVAGCASPLNPCAESFVSRISPVPCASDQAPG
ncbi:hypothetical protein AURDEDRAFT_167714 [Auricularia subglabra TFB-10046 SS5]|nr:hypothetical protein AURDEDRAFT_167714 [Auricularia subglabra TFB-10046 SS5]